MTLDLHARPYIVEVASLWCDTMPTLSFEGRWSFATAAEAHAVAARYAVMPSIRLALLDAGHRLDEVDADELDAPVFSSSVFRVDATLMEARGESQNGVTHHHVVTVVNRAAQEVMHQLAAA